MCYVLFSAWSRAVGVLQISVIIINVLTTRLDVWVDFTLDVLRFFFFFFFSAFFSRGIFAVIGLVKLVYC